MTDYFRIGMTAGALGGDSSKISTILDGYDKDPEPEWTFSNQYSFEDMPNGGRFAQGKPVATWRWGGLRFEQRQLLRAYCPNGVLSYPLYIRTATNETVAGVRTYNNYSCIMRWTHERELIDLNAVLQVLIVFTHLEVV